MWLEFSDHSPVVLWTGSSWGHVVQSPWCWFHLWWRLQMALPFWIEQLPGMTSQPLFYRQHQPARRVEFAALWGLCCHKSLKRHKQVHIATYTSLIHEQEYWGWIMLYLQKHYSFIETPQSVHMASGTEWKLWQSDSIHCSGGILPTVLCIII